MRNFGSIRVPYFVIFLILLYSTHPVVAAYLTDMPVTLTQPDGTVIRCFASGDEFHNWLHDADNYTIVKSSSTGYYTYAEKDGENVKAGSLIVGRDDAQRFRQSPGVNISKRLYSEKRSSFEQRPSERAAPSIGTINNIVVFIRFADQTEFEDETSMYNGWLNSNTNSLHNYFQEVSYNKLNVSSTLYPTSATTTVVSYQDSLPRNYYCKYDTTNTNGYTSDNRYLRKRALLAGAINFVDADIPDGLILDGDGDGKVDNVVFIVRGQSEGWAELLWPHMSYLNEPDICLNDIEVGTYNFQLQGFLSSRSVGVLCHEFFHSLGAPDLYHYEEDSEFSPAGQWDIMCGTCNPPQHMNAYMKWKYGHWIEPIPTVTLDQEYIVFPATDSLGLAYKIDSPYSLTEFFIVEYRRKTGVFENSVPGSGLLVWRVNTACGNGNADGPPDEMYVYRPNGTSTENGSTDAAFFSLESGRTEMNDITNPYPFLSDDSSGGLDIQDIGSAGDSITFTKNTPYATTIEFPPDTYWEGFNDGFCPPEGWLTTEVTGSDEFEHVYLANNPPAMPYEGLQMLGYPSHTAPTGSSAIIATPRIHIAEPSDYEYSVSFMMYRDDGFPSTPDRVEVYFNNSAALTGDYTQLATINRSTSLAPVADTTGWYQYNFTMYPPVEGYYHVIIIAISAGGNNIYLDNFTLNKGPFPATTSVWLGNTSSDWFTSSNWRNGYLPDSGQDVVIPANSPHLPIIENSNASCRDLRIDGDASLQIQNVTLTVYGNANISGELIMMVTTPKLIVYGDLSFNKSSQVVGSNPIIEVHGNFAINNSSLFEMDDGLMKLTGSSNSSFTCNTQWATLKHLTIQKFGATVYLSMDDDSKLRILGDFVIANGANFTAIVDTCNIVCYGNLTSYGDLRAYVGNIEFAGTAPNINLSSTSFLNNVKMTSSSTLTLLSNLTLLGDFTFSTGIIDATNRTIRVGGDWITNFADQFIGMGSTVIFDGFEDQYCQTTDFNFLELNKGSGNLIISSSMTVHALSYDYTNGTIYVAGGSFIVEDLADTNIKGAYILQSGEISLRQDSGHYTDLDADIEIHGGSMTIYGGINFPIDWAHSREITVEMDGGILSFVDNGIGLTETGHFLNAWITGGTIRTSGSFVVNRMGFYPAGGTIELIGTDDAVVTQHIASSIYNLKISKGSRSDPIFTSSRSITRSNTVTFTGDTIIDNDLIIASGILDLGAMYLSVGGDLDVYGSLVMTNGNAILDINGSASFHDGSVNTITTGAINVGASLTLYDDIGMEIGVDNTFSLVGSQPCYLKLYDGDASFGNLIIDKTSATVSTDTGGHHLLVSGIMAITGESQVVLENTTGVIDSLLSVEGTLICGSGSLISTRDVHLSGSLSVDHGYVIIGDDFTQETWGVLTIDDGTCVLDAPYSGALFGFAGVVNLNWGVLQITYEGIQFGPSSQFSQLGGTLKVGWGFRAISSNVFLPGAGSVEFIGARLAEIQCNNGNYFHDLIFNKPSTSNAIYLMTDITVNNDLTVQGGNATLLHHTLNVNRDVIITGGRLTAGNEDDIINVGRNWTNTYGVTGFIEGAGTVNFVSGLDATISTENFNLVCVNKPVQGPDLLHVGTGETVTVDKTLGIDVGCLKLDDNSTLKVNDDIFISDYSGLNISSAGTDNALYLGGSLYDYSSIVDATHGFTAHPNSMTVIDGDSIQVLSGAYASMTFNSVSVNKASGRVLHSNDITFTGNLDIINGDWSCAVPDKTKNFFGDLWITSGGSFTDSTGTCNFLGNNDSGIYIDGLTRMPSISILKSAGIHLYLAGNATFAGHTDISMLSGILSLNTHTLQFQGTLTLSEDCIFIMDNGSVLSLGDSSALSFGYGTSFISYGLSGNPAKITSFDGYYALTIGSDASISAEHTVFEKMNFEGVNIEPGALVDSLHCFKYCTFREGESGGVLLQMNSSQDLNVYYADFPANTWGSMYNVSRYNPLGSINMMNATGAFAGAAYESDLYNNINWEILAQPAVPQNLDVSSSGNDIVIFWDEVPGASGYNIYRSFTPDDPVSFELVGTTESTNWSEGILDLYPDAFYYVTAYIE